MRELYKACGLPVFQNKMYPDQTSALASPLGDVVLVQDMDTGLIFNSKFDSTLLDYDQDYQNEQAYSSVFKEHLESVKRIIKKHFSDELIIEVGCGKGYFLDYLIDNGFDVKGIDPAYEGDNPNVIKACFENSLGITAENIVLRHVLEHIPDPFSFLEAISKANGGLGKIYIEVPCFDWICNNNAWFDVFYEHVNYFRLSDFNRIFSKVYASGNIFGGQYLYVVADLSSLQSPKGSEFEHLYFPNNFLPDLDVLAGVAKDKKNVVWGGASKGVIFSLYLKRAGIDVDFIIDINPSKQGKFIAGTGLKVSTPEEALTKLNLGDNVFVMNGNYLDEIKKMSGNNYNYITVDNKMVEG